MPETTTRRVPSQTAESINHRIRHQTELNITYYAAHVDEIDRRLEELDQEWDVERALETLASSASLFGLVWGSTFGGRKWYLLPTVAMGFFLQHAIQGWCPPLPMLRRFGFRTAGEIDEERYALKALRGDFQNISNHQGEGHLPDSHRILEAVEK